MNIVIGLLAGAILGWLTFSFMGWNEGRSRIVSMVIGGLGGFVGAKLVAPMFTDAVVAGAFSLSVVIFAMIVSTACLALGNLINNRWGV
jgi:uncharacterized membrane protein YeaQ/YmgE (transglycosylase-associated protein family)